MEYKHRRPDDSKETRQTKGQQKRSYIHLITSELTAPWLVAATAKWVASQRTIQFAVAATSYS